MPVKKSCLIDISKFHKAAHNDNLQAYEKNLQELMDQANDIYDKVYNDSKNDPDIDKFNTCRINFSEIKSIIESNANSTPLINKIYIEAWISILYSEVHALNLKIETESQLNELTEKIQLIEIDFKKLSAEKRESNLNLSVKGTADLLKYIQNFEIWKINKIKLLADAYYNFGLTLEEDSNLEQALLYFTGSKNFYNQAAEIAADSVINMNFKKKLSENKLSQENLKKSAEQTQEKIKSLLNKKNPEAALKKLSIRLQRLPESASKWTIVNNSSHIQSIKEKQELKIKEKHGLSSKIKRKSNEESTYPEAKKQKLDFRTLDFKKILDKFNDLNINLSEITNTKKSFDERRAIVHNNYAIYLIEDLNNKDKTYNNCKKLKLLKKAEQVLIKSSEFYKKADLVKENDKIIECLTTINLCQENLKTQIQSPVHQKDSTIKTQEFPTKSLTLPIDKMRRYQTTFSTRLAYKFFNTYLPENNVKTAKPIIRNISP